MAPPLCPWSLLAVPAIVVGGIALHFLFSWSRGNRLVAVVAPVNESLWEHLKMAYWPAVLYTAIQVAVSDRPLPTLPAAQMSAFMVTAAAMLLISVAMSAVSPQMSDTREVVSHGIIFVVSVIAGQAVGHALLSTAATALPGGAPGVAAFAVPAVVFAVATFRPPHRWPFEDQLTGGYGIQPGSQRR